MASAEYITIYFGVWILAIDIMTDIPSEVTIIMRRERWDNLILKYKIHIFDFSPFF
jgi:hypothetical protein